MKTGEQVVRGLVNTRRWSEETARLGQRARYRCEYCGFDFLQSVEAYKLWQVDHIVPGSSRSAELFDNKAIACRQCNMDFKRRWDPRERAGPHAKRERLIQVTREYIRERKALTQNELSLVREIVGYE